MTDEEMEFIRLEDGVYDNDLRQTLNFKRNILGYETPLITAVITLTVWNVILQDHTKFFSDHEKKILSELPDLDLLTNNQLLITPQIRNY